MRRESRGPWLLAACGLGLDVLAWWPGQLSFDSAHAWWQARGGETTDIVAPAFTLTWRALLPLDDGPGPVFALQLVLFWSGLALLARALALSWTRTAALMVLVGFAPVSWLLRGHVWTDVLLTAALVFAVAALARAERDRRWLAAAGPALLLAAVLRHNALPAVLPLLAWAAWIAMPRASRMRIAWATLGLLLVPLGAARLLQAAVDRHVPVWPSLAQFDLAAVSIDTGEWRLPAFLRGPGLTIDELADAFRPWSNLPMLTGTRHGIRAPFDPPLTPDELAALRDAWRDAIRDEPLAWLDHRMRLARALFGTHARDWPRELVFVADAVAYRDNPPVSRNAGMLHRTLLRGADRLRATPLLAAWPILLAGLVAVPRAWRRRHSTAGRAALLALASAWLYAAPLVLLAPSAELRYLGWPCTASLLALAMMLLAARSDGAARLAPDPQRNSP